MSRLFFSLKAMNGVFAPSLLALLLVGPVVLSPSAIAAEPVNCQWCSDNFDSNQHWFKGNLCDTLGPFCILCSASSDGGCHSGSVNGLCMMAHSGGHGGGGEFVTVEYSPEEFMPQARMELMGDYELVLNSEGMVVKASRVARNTYPLSGEQVQV